MEFQQHRTNHSTKRESLSVFNPEQLPPSLPPRPKLVFASEQMKRVVRLVKKYAKSTAAVLVTGESGTGKELICRMIHEESQRKQQRLVSVNCAAIPDLLVESEFFGHVRGAFTGAVRQRVGYFEQADSGTLMLDEISEVSLGTQSKLLRVLEEKIVQPVGAEGSRTVDVRVVATSNRSLNDEVAEGRFRLDLYHRLNVLRIYVPPIRERRSDLKKLAEYFVQRYRVENSETIRELSSCALKKLCSYDWPGNVRELRNVIHRACVIAEGGVVQAEDIELDRSIADTDDLGVRGKSIAEVERILILDGLERYQGDKERVAHELGITTRTINSKLAKYRNEAA